MGKSRLDMRREVEAAEAIEKTAPAKKKARKKAAKKAVRKTTTRARRVKDAPTRRRLIWVVYSSTMREEGRFLYHERAEAEAKLEQLLSKGKRRYFIQPIKEPLDSEGNPLVVDDEPAGLAKKTAPKKAAPVKKKEPEADADDGDSEDEEEAEE